MDPISTFIEKYLAWLLSLAGMVLLVFHLQAIAQGTGTLTNNATTFIKDFE